MEERKRLHRRSQMIIGILIDLIVFGVSFTVSVYSFNHTERQYISGKDCNDFTVDIAPRTGKTDSWPKILEENCELILRRISI